LKVIMPVACDLARNSEWNVVVGPETAIACDRAAELTMMDEDAFIVITAGRASIKWDNRLMADVMMKYIVYGCPRLRGRLRVSYAKTFDTWGEMEGLAVVLSQLSNFRGDCEKVVLVVKWWHGPRSWLFCKYHFWCAGVRGVKVKVSWCKSFASFKAKRKELRKLLLSPGMIALDLLKRWS